MTFDEFAVAYRARVNRSLCRRDARRLAIGVMAVGLIAEVSWRWWISLV
jgi:hypothetical protein